MPRPGQRFKEKVLPFGRKNYRCTLTEGGEFWHCTVVDKKAFDKRSFRVVDTVPGEVELTTGCPRGQFDPRKPKNRQCRVPLSIQRIMIHELSRYAKRSPLPGKRVQPVLPHPPIK